MPFHSRSGPPPEEWPSTRGVALHPRSGPPPHDDRKGHHYYTPASQADSSVYSSDDPAVIMGWGVIMRLTSGIVVIAGGLLALLLQPVR